MYVFDNYLQFISAPIMKKLFVLLIMCGLFLSGCRYWVLYEFAEQFCEFEDYVSVSWNEPSQQRQLQINFEEPVLDRHILLRYLNAMPLETLKTSDNGPQPSVVLSDIFAIHQTYIHSNTLSEPFQFRLNYHPLNEAPLLQQAYLDARLSQLFSPLLVEPILRSLCSDVYDLSLKQLDMRFKLASLPKHSLPVLHELKAIFGKAEESIIELSGEQTLRYEFDFLSKDLNGAWKKQERPITMLFGFDEERRLNNLYIKYYKYSYWLDVESLSGRLLVIRRGYFFL